MTESIIEPGVVHTLGHLQHIQNSLPPFSQLRFISGTSLNHSFGVISIVYDRETDAVLLVPYFLKKSHEETPKNEVPENPESLALRLIAKEAALQSRTVCVLGSPIPVEDRKNKGKSFLKFIVLIANFKAEDRIKIESNSSKNGNPFWVSRELLSYVFGERFVVEEQIKEHPHLKAYERFAEDFPLRHELEKW